MLTAQPAMAGQSPPGDGATVDLEPPQFASQQRAALAWALSVATNHLLTERTGASRFKEQSGAATYSPPPIQSCLSASHSSEVVIEMKRVADCEGRDKRIGNQRIQNQRERREKRAARVWVKDAKSSVNKDQG